jgi:hypothetical protein
MQRFTDLKVWQPSHALVLSVYRASEPFPATERYGLTSQLRRAAMSVPTNIAEGAKRLTSEQAQPLIAGAEEITRMLNALRQRVQGAA